jgi:hypothetical protein
VISAQPAGIGAAPTLQHSKKFNSQLITPGI